MSKSEDVQTLFRRFGGNASTYQEVVSRDQVAQAETKWPILGLINPTANQEAPSVRRPSVPPSSRQNQPQSGGSLPVGGLTQSAPLVDTVLNHPAAPASLADMFTGLAPSRSVQPSAADKLSVLPQSAASAGAHSHERDSQVVSPVSRPVPAISGAAQGGLFNRFKAVVRPVVVKLSPAAEPVVPVADAPSEPVPVPPSPSVSIDPPPVGGGMFASLIPAPSIDLSGSLGYDSIRGVPAARLEGAQSKVVQGSDLQALFGRMLPPPVPAAMPKKPSKSSKKAVKW